MNVTEAAERRISTRAFRSDPVSGDLVRRLLEQAGRAASGGNLQPWRVHALTGEALQAMIAAADAAGPNATPGYPVYPAQLWEPYRSRRYQVGEALYGAIGVAREDREGRLAQYHRNRRLFGAPVGIFVSLERRMGPPQWADCGMFLQALMLLAVEAGLATCAQEYWVQYARTVELCLGLPQTHMLYSGLALGYADEDAPINGWRTTRAPFEEWAELRGF